MARFRYRAMNESSMIIDGVLTANDEFELEEILSGQGLYIIEFEKIHSFSFRKLPKVKFEDLFEFTYYLQLFLTSGISIISGLLSLVNQKNKSLSYIAELLYKDVNAGVTLSTSMEKYKNIFPEFYVQIVRAGEKSSNLDRVFSEIMNYLNWQIDLKKTIKNALYYPIIILFSVFGLIILLFTFVVPKLQKVLLSLNVELPLPTKLVIGLGSIFKAYSFIIFPALILLFFSFKIATKIEQGKRIVDFLVLKIPLVSDLVKKINYSRYFKTISTLFASGLNIEQTFSTGATVVTNTIISEKLHQVTNDILSGDTITQALTKSGLFSSFIIQMTSVGERTGSFEEVSIKISEALDKEVKDSVRMILLLLEPIIIVLLGIVVLMVMLSIFLPIYKMLGGIRGK